MRPLLALPLLLLVACTERHVAGPPPADGNPAPATTEAASTVASSAASPTPPAAAGDASSWQESVRLERWVEAAARIDALPEDVRSRPELRYVRARAAVGTGDGARAVTLLEGLEPALPLLAADIARWRAEAAAPLRPVRARGRVLRKGAHRGGSHPRRRGVREGRRHGRRPRHRQSRGGRRVPRKGPAGGGGRAGEAGRAGLVPGRRAGRRARRARSALGGGARGRDARGARRRRHARSDHDGRPPQATGARIGPFPPGGAQVPAAGVRHGLRGFRGPYRSAPPRPSSPAASPPPGHAAGRGAARPGDGALPRT